MKRLVLIDAHAIIHRAYHALPRLTAPDGTLVNAVYGFASILLKMLRELKPDYAAAAFDLAAPTLRHIAFEAYKATRVKAPDELYAQIPVVRELLDAFGIPVLDKEGYEADDIIGTIAKRVEKEHPDVEIVIVTGDLDTLQLVSRKTKVFTMRKGITDTVLYDEQAVQVRYGLEPEKLADLRGLRGDPSDNIPGVRGIGEKTAILLLQKFGSVEALYEQLNKKKAKGLSPAIAAKLEGAEEAAKLSKALATIELNVPVPISLGAMRLAPPAKNRKIQELFTRLGFQSLLRRLSEGPAPEAAPPSTLPVRARLAVRPIAVKSFGEVPHGDHDALLAADAGLLVIGSADRAYVLPKSAIRSSAAAKWISESKVLYVFDLKSLLHQGFPKIYENVRDVLLFWYLLNPDRRTFLLEDLLIREFRLSEPPRGKAESAGLFWELSPKLERRLKGEELFEVYRELESPLTPILAKMEEVGIGFDSAPFAALSKTMQRSLQFLEAEIHGLAGGPFNINSPSKLAEVLFLKLKLPIKGLRRTEKGKVLSTSAAELTKLRKLHPIVDFILEYREYAKLKSTYVDALPKLVGRDRRIHTTWNQTGTATGRLSSQNPNLQNIPIRSPLGREIRKAFVGEKKFSLATFDYSQLELRIAASLAQDEKMIDAFRRGLDIHRLTAAEVSNIPYDRVSPELRYQAKALNFGILYGMGPRAFAESAGISREEAERFMEEYFQDFQGVQRFIEATKEFARAHGFTKTAFGRKRYFPEILSTNFRRQREAERMAVNHPIQGTAADIAKKATIEAERLIAERGWGNDLRLLLQIHDELLFEINGGMIEAVAPEIQKTMERVWAGALVPMPVEVKRGSNWGELK